MCEHCHIGAFSKCPPKHWFVHADASPSSPAFPFLLSFGTTKVGSHIYKRQLEARETDKNWGRDKNKEKRCRKNNPLQKNLLFFTKYHFSQQPHLFPPDIFYFSDSPGSWEYVDMRKIALGRPEQWIDILGLFGVCGGSVLLLHVFCLPPSSFAHFLGCYCTETSACWVLMTAACAFCSCCLGGCCQWDPPWYCV